jgi:hypothetical protein
MLSSSGNPAMSNISVVFAAIKRKKFEWPFFALMHAALVQSQKIRGGILWC